VTSGVTVSTDVILGRKMNWLENSNSSVSLDGQKLAQLIGNREKPEAFSFPTATDTVFV